MKKTSDHPFTGTGHVPVPVKCAMGKTITRSKGIFFCLLSVAAAVAITLLITLLPTDKPIDAGTYSSAAYDVTRDGPYSEGWETRVTLWDGTYYMTLNSREIERGRYNVDENGVAMLIADVEFLADGENAIGHLIPIKGKQFVLLTRNGQSHYMDIIGPP